MLWWTYQQLRSSSMKTRLAVVAKLAESKHADSVEPLLFALKDSMAEIRSAAALSLGQFQDSRAVEPLTKLLRDPVPLVRATAVQSLGQLQTHGVIGELVGLLRDSDATVRLRAAHGLDRLGWHPEDDSAQTAYVLALGDLDRVAELGADGIRPLVELLNNGTPEQQLSAVKALSEISDPRIPKLMQEALKKNSALVRLAALEILGKLADPSSYEVVQRLFKDQASNIRAAAVGTAVSCGDKRAGPMLVPMLRDASWEVRLEVVKALGTLGDETAVEGLCRALQDKDHDVRESAAQSLGKLGDARAIQPLVTTLLDVQSFVRTAAHNALYRIDRYWKKSDAARSALPQIKAARTHREYWISQSAEKLLEQIQPGSEKAEAGWTPASPTRAADSAGQPATTAPHPALAILVDLLRDHDRDLRLAAAEALGDLREKNAAPNLLTASRDSDAFVRQAAEHALAVMN
jgi:HEAT repeat protein